MRRRVARVLRIGSLLLGAAILALVPLSWYWSPYLVLPGDSWHSIYIEPNELRLHFEDAPSSTLDFGMPHIWRTPFSNVRALPRVTRIQGVGTEVAIPLWLLAFICLAWPVTSFIIARRRHKRGFPVEPRAGGEAVSPPVSSS